METKDIRDLLAFIAKTGLEAVDIHTPNLQLKVRRSAEVLHPLAPGNSHLVLAPCAGKFLACRIPATLRGTKVQEGDLLGAVQMTSGEEEQVVAPLEGVVEQVFVEGDGMVEKGQPLFQVVHPEK